MKTVFRKIAILSFLVMSVGASALLVASPVLAQDVNTCGGADGVKTSFDFGCPDSTSTKSPKLENNPIYVVLVYVVNTMAIGVGVAIIGGIVWQSIQYAASNGQPDKAKNARTGIVNAVIALLLFLSMYAILNFIIPGGIIG